MSKAIIRLADSQLNEQVASFGGLDIGGDIGAALQELKAEEQKVAVKEAAKEILGLVKLADQGIVDNVECIREARRTESAAVKRISEINKAKAYGIATNNFVPLGVLLYKIREYDVDDKSLLKIDESKLPEGWDKKPAAK